MWYTPRMAWHDPKYVAAVRFLINVMFGIFNRSCVKITHESASEFTAPPPFSPPTPPPYPNVDVYAATFPLQLKMLRRIAVLCVVVSVTTCLRSGNSISNRQRKTSGGYAARTDSDLGTGNGQQPYVSYIKLHPGQVKWYLIYIEVSNIANRVKVNNK